MFTHLFSCFHSEASISRSMAPSRGKNKQGHPAMNDVTASNCNIKLELDQNRSRMRAEPNIITYKAATIITYKAATIWMPKPGTLVFLSNLQDLKSQIITLQHTSFHINSLIRIYFKLLLCFVPLGLSYTSFLLLTWTKSQARMWASLDSTGPDLHLSTRPKQDWHSQPCTGPGAKPSSETKNTNKQKVNHAQDLRALWFCTNSGRILKKKHNKVWVFDHVQTNLNSAIIKHHVFITTTANLQNAWEHQL